MLYSLVSSWLTPLNDMMCKVNERFSRFFSQMGCAGEVSLLKHEDVRCIYLCNSDIKTAYLLCRTLASMVFRLGLNLGMRMSYMCWMLIVRVEESGVCPPCCIWWLYRTSPAVLFVWLMRSIRCWDEHTHTHTHTHIYQPIQKSHINLSDNGWQVHKYKRFHAQLLMLVFLVPILCLFCTVREWTQETRGKYLTW